MRQILQSLKTGQIEVVEAPAPLVRRRHVLIEARRSLISAGTERMLLEFGKSNLLQKALQQPDKVKQTLQKVQSDGLSATFEAIRSKLDQPLPLGYCSAGIVRAVGSEVSHVRVGDRVVSNAPHAELAVVGRNLVARIPDNVSDDEAAFTPLAAIALQGCRLAQPTLGETFCVIGLGLIGLIAVQLLRACGCRVIGADLSEERLVMARMWGAETIHMGGDEDPVASALAATSGSGADGVLIAAATKSNEVVSQAARMSRKRGRIVLVGVVGLTLTRDEFYDKELTFQVSCSYGPGRYDPQYEVHGDDYPVAFVRWTEQRNFEAVLAEMAVGRLNVSPMITDTIDISDAATAYARLSNRSAGDLGLLLSYPESRSEKFVTRVMLGTVPAKASPATVALVGAGNFGGRVTAPALKAAGAMLKTIVSQSGVSGVIEGRKAGFASAATDIGEILSDTTIDTVVIATRHDSHASLTMRALQAGKHVFVEKPLAIFEHELDEIKNTLASIEKVGAMRQLMVGFNRRFSPFSVRMKLLLDTVREPKALIAIINAGAIPSGHWTQDREQGGGRIVGEACHFIDLMRFFVGAPIVSIAATRFGRPGADGVAEDKMTITISFEDGSIATVHYFANGPKSLAKERYEAFAGGRFIRLDNFRRIETIGWRSGSDMRGTQDKGQAAVLDTFIKAVKSGGPPLIPAAELIEVSRWTIRAANCASEPS